MASADVFSAIAAPARRRLLARLAEADLPVQELAKSFEMTLPAVSQHLCVLRDAGLVAVRKQGKQRIYRLTPEPLKVVADWASRYEPFWSDRLDALREVLEKNR